MVNFKFKDEIVILSLVVLFSVVFSSILSSQNRQINRLKRENSILKSHQKTLVGSTKLYNGKMINYNLKSWDNGKNWYQVEYNKDGGMKIIGDVEKIYPGLVNFIENFHKFLDTKDVKYVKKASETTTTNGLKVKEN